MAFESDAFLDADVRRCADYFSAKLQRPMTIYAFPNGSCREGQVERVQAAEVEHVLLVGERFDCSARIHHRFTFDARSPAHVRVKATGAWPGRESDCRFRRCVDAARTRPQIGRNRPARPYRQNTIAAGGTAPMVSERVSVTLARGLRRAWLDSATLMTFAIRNGPRYRAACMLRRTRPSWRQSSGMSDPT